SYRERHYLDRFKKFKREGMAVKFGKFSKEENDQLRKNVDAFMKESGIDSVEKLFFPHRFPEEKRSINKLKYDLSFGVKIAEGIPRPWRLVYYRARKMLDPRNYIGKYSETEKMNLKYYQALYGNNWKKISELMSRSSHSLALKYSELKFKTNSGPWSREETKKLIEAMEETLLLKVRGLDSALENREGDQALMLVRENLYKNIPWAQVEARVGTRNWRQCKRKWLSVVTKKMSGGQTKNYGLENLQVKINLIERLYEMNIEDADQIDWEELSKVIGNVPPAYVRNRFHKMKTVYVPFWYKRTFPEIIYILYEVTLPKLKNLQAKQMANRYTKAMEPNQSESCNQKKVFRFSDIFQDSDLEENLNSEEESCMATCCLEAT
uniref:Myb-like domain-containing protein n=1 Tax=Salvator merianae TaxID=96440 RepID=A0A8D0CDF4_SALMN